MRPQPYTQEDFSVNPLMFYYEVTQACDLVCKHCRASAQETAAPDELPTETALALLEDVARFPRKPTICFTGGDPLKRADLFDLIRHATELGIGSALTPSATPLATFDAFKKAKEAGVSAIGISIDGPNPEVHDAFRGFDGSFNKALDMLQYARDLELPVQVNTSITRRNAALVDEIADMLEDKGIMMWSVFFLVPVGPPIRHGTGRLADSRAEKQAKFSEFRVCRRNEDAAGGKQRRRQARDWTWTWARARAFGRDRRARHYVRRAQWGNLPGRLSSGRLRAVPERFGRRRLSESSDVQGAPESR